MAGWEVLMAGWEVELLVKTPTGTEAAFRVDYPADGYMDRTRLQFLIDGLANAAVAYAELEF